MKMAFSIVRGRHSKNAVEKAARIIFTVCAFFAVLAVFSITLYMLINGTPALFKVGLKDIPVSYTHLDVYKRQEGRGISAGSDFSGCG